MNAYIYIIIAISYIRERQSVPKDNHTKKGWNKPTKPQLNEKQQDTQQSTKQMVREHN